MNSINKTSRIAIIGAGPGGLSSAESLKNKGFSNITVFEKNNRAGGQNSSQIFTTPAGKKIFYELGSLQPISSKRLYQLFKQYHIQLGKEPFGKKGYRSIVYSKKEQKNVLDFQRYHFGCPTKDLFALFPELIKLLYQLFRYRNIFKPGFHHMSEEHLKELAVPFEDWVDAKNFDFINTQLKLIGGLFSTLANARDRKTLAALYAIKVLQQILHFPMRYINGHVVQAREGYQELWNRIAAQHNVKYQIEIQSIERKNNKIIIRYQDRTEEFDYLIVSCIPNYLFNQMDFTEQEKNLFTQVQYYPGWRGVFSAKNMRHDAGVIVIDHFLTDDFSGNISGFWPEGQIDENTYLYGMALNYPEQENSEQAFQNAEHFLKEHFGATKIEWIKKIYWPDYGTHFSIESVKNGIHYHLEKLQGNKNTFWVGQTMSIGTNPIVIDYAYDVMDRFF